ncbi:MAG: hypothetical protein ACRED4_07035 [Brevundimonas sp.]
MATTLEIHLAARKANQEAVGEKLNELLAIIAQAEADGLYPDGLTVELSQVQMVARVNAKKLAPPPPVEDPIEDPAE